jgi:hypothetical protein
MSLEKFLESPWLKSHKAYDTSWLNIRPAPEFATAEVVVASTYRKVGFDGYSEKVVPAAGRAFDKASNRTTNQFGRDRVSQETWRTILHGVLESPKQPNQSAKRFLQLCPVVPDVALYSGSARNSANSWDPGELVKRMIQWGSESDEAAQKLWSELFDGLSVSDTDDVWARWLQCEFEARCEREQKWQPTSLSVASFLPSADRRDVAIPATQFVNDLRAILAAKGSMTRRQWISLLESLLRLAAVSHVVWLCDVNSRYWRIVRRVIDGAKPPSADELKTMLFTLDQAYLTYGSTALPTLRDYASRYLASRLGLNLLLWTLNPSGTIALSSISHLSAFLQLVENSRAKLNSDATLKSLSELEDTHARVLGCKKGIGSNLSEFFRHVLGQRQTAVETLRGYDQGYQLKKKGDYASAPWVTALGPVSLLAIVHCCLAEVSGPRSVQRFCEHLQAYGVQVPTEALEKGEVGRNLRLLGLVLDSPDAESGMLLVPPFQSTNSKVGPA